MRELVLLVLLGACTHAAPVVRLGPPLTYFLPTPRGVDANRWTREVFIACRVDTDCHRRIRR